MINGRDEMKENIATELRFLKSMTDSAQDSIEIQCKLIDINEAKLKEAELLLDRFNKRTLMCYHLQKALESFDMGLDDLAGRVETERPPRDTTDPAERDTLRETLNKGAEEVTAKVAADYHDEAETERLRAIREAV